MPRHVPDPIGENLMKQSSFYYSVGALLYCPANNQTIISSVIHQKFNAIFSLALCLEDTIHDDYVDQAEEQLISSIREIFSAAQAENFYLPKIFIRVRDSKQISRLVQELGFCIEIVTGFIIPKFSLENADTYIRTIGEVNSTSNRNIYVMPIYESTSIIDLRTRYEILYSLKEKLDLIEDLVLNIRVGGNDLCHAFGFRRHVNESIHQIGPIANIFSDILTVYGLDYVISGPVWEYYNGTEWKKGLEKELVDDRLCGFIGKTVIHPNQIEVVNLSHRVNRKDFEDAKLILGWEDDTASMVSGCSSGERMNEYKTHFNWAQRTIFLAETFGLKP